MIKVDPVLLVTVGMSMLVLAYALTQLISFKGFPGKTLLRKVRQCIYCSRLIEMKEVGSIWVCPVCKSYVEEEYAQQS